MLLFILFRLELIGERTFEEADLTSEYMFTRQFHSSCLLKKIKVEGDKIKTFLNFRAFYSSFIFAWVAGDNQCSRKGKVLAAACVT